MRHREEKQVQPAAINEPTSLENLHSMELIYGKIFLVDEWVRTWDMGAIKKHPEHLTTRGMLIFSSERYVSV